MAKFTKFFIIFYTHLFTLGNFHCDKFSHEIFKMITYSIIDFFFSHVKISFWFNYQRPRSGAAY